MRAWRALGRFGVGLLAALTGAAVGVGTQHLFPHPDISFAIGVAIGWGCGVGLFASMPWERTW